MLGQYLAFQNLVFSEGIVNVDVLFDFEGLF